MGKTMAPTTPADHVPSSQLSTLRRPGCGPCGAAVWGHIVYLPLSESRYAIRSSRSFPVAFTGGILFFGSLIFGFGRYFASQAASLFVPTAERSGPSLPPLSPILWHAEHFGLALR